MRCVCLSKVYGGKLKSENMIHKDEVMARHESKIIELRTKLRQNEYAKNINISEHISKCCNNRWLKGIASDGIYDAFRQWDNENSLTNSHGDEYN